MKKTDYHIATHRPCFMGLQAKMLSVFICLSFACWMLFPHLSYGEVLLKQYTKARPALKLRQQHRVRTKSNKQVHQAIHKKLKKLGHVSDAYHVETLKPGLYLAYTKSHIHPGRYDSLQLFKQDRRGRISVANVERTVYRSITRKKSDAEVIALWQQTAKKVLTQRYRKQPKKMLQIDQELQFLENEINKRKAKHPALELPWKTDYVDSEISLPFKPNMNDHISVRLANGTAVSLNSFDALARNAVHLFELSGLPLHAFKRVLSYYHANGRGEGNPMGDATAADFGSLKDKRSKIRRHIETDLGGFEFPAQHGAWVSDKFSIKDTLEAVVHELNHVANRIPQKPQYSQKEELASELTAFATEQGIQGRPMSQHQIRRLKNQIIELYQLDTLNVDSIPDKIQGNQINWVPRFPKQQESKYLKAWFGATQKSNAF